jgi:hypothetical protein
LVVRLTTLTGLPFSQKICTSSCVSLHAFSGCVYLPTAPCHQHLTTAERCIHMHQQCACALAGIDARSRANHACITCGWSRAESQRGLPARRTRTRCGTGCRPLSRAVTLAVTYIRRWPTPLAPICSPSSHLQAVPRRDTHRPVADIHGDGDAALLQHHPSVSLPYQPVEPRPYTLHPTLSAIQRSPAFIHPAPYTQSFVVVGIKAHYVRPCNTHTA